MFSLASINYIPPQSSPTPPNIPAANTPVPHVSVPHVSVSSPTPVLENTTPTPVTDIGNGSSFNSNPETNLDMHALDSGAGFWENIISSEMLFSLIGQVGLGGILGFATGYALKKALKIVLIIIGVLFIIIQAGVFFDILSVNWMRVQEMVNPFLEADSLEQSWRGFLTMITANIPFAGGFVPMLIWGLRKG